MSMNYTIFDYYRAWLVQWGGLCCVLVCLNPHFSAAKIFYDLRLALRFVCYNGCELGDGH